MHTTSSAVDNSILARLWPASPRNAILRGVVLVLAGTALLAMSAHTQVPFWPVKMSMQTFVVLVLAVAYGGRLAAATVLAYLAEGAVGLPVFVGGAGPAYFAGPTAGYLVGFAVAAFFVGTLAERGTMRTLPRALFVLFSGDAIVFALGVAWLAVLFGLEKAAYAGLVVFLPAEALKIALAAALVPLLRRGVPETPRNA